MPLSQFLCEVEHEPVAFPDCLACSRAVTPPRGRRCQFTHPLLQAMAHHEASRDGVGLSVTGLVGCTRQTALQLLAPYAAYPHQLYPMLRGTLIHTSIAAQQEGDPPEAGILAERRFERLAAPGIPVTGQPDEIDLRRQLIVDYKTCKQLPAQPREEHIWQLNLYRWLVADGRDVTTGEQVSYEIEQLGIVYLAANEVHKVGVPSFDLEQVGRFAAERATTIRQALAGGRLPPRAFDPQTHPICRSWCPVRAQCLAAGPAGDPPETDTAAAQR